MFVGTLRTGLLVCGVALSLAFSAEAQSSACWFPLTVEVVGEHPSLQQVSAKNLAVKVHGREAQVKVANLQLATKVIVVLDTSGSMKSHGWTNLLTLSRDLLEGAVASGKRVGLTTFGDKAINASGKADSLKLLAETAQRGPSGRTKLLDTLVYSAHYFNADRETVMFVITDGGDNLSSTYAKDDRRELLREGVRVSFIIPKSDKRPATAEELDGPMTVGEIADVTGGYVIFLDLLPENSKNVFAADAARRLMEYYRVEIADASKGKLKVGLQDDSGRHAKDVRAHYPREVNCEPQTGKQ